MKDLHEIASRARQAYYSISVSSDEKRNACLKKLAELLTENKTGIFTANRADVESAEAENLAAPLLLRLMFGEE